MGQNSWFGANDDSNLCVCVCVQVLFGFDKSFLFHLIWIVKTSKDVCSMMMMMMINGNKKADKSVQWRQQQQR